MTPIEQIRKSIFGGIQPKGIVMNLINKSNPMASKLIGMAENGDSKGVETFARNLLKEKGLDYDKEMASFKGKLGIK
jgi:hypothetical protein